MLEHVHWLGHASIKISGDKTVYVDPYQIHGGETADIILITHNHYDHLSKEDIEKIRSDQTAIVIPASCEGKLKGNVKTINAGETLTIEGVKIRAVPSYNLGKSFHPRDRHNLGYVFTLNDVTYYHAGDTDHIPEMKEVKADVAFLPVGGTYTMTAEEAARAVEDINPKTAVPIHWGSIVGSRRDADTFKSLCSCDVEILESEG